MNSFTDSLIDHSHELGRGYGPYAQVDMLHNILELIGPTLDKVKLQELINSVEFIEALDLKSEEDKAFVLGQLQDALNQ